MIKTGNLDNVGKHSNLMIGQMAMDNKHGKSNLQLGQTNVGGSYTNTAIGLMNLDTELANLAEQQQPLMFQNVNGKRNILLKDFTAAGEKTTSNIGEMAMNNAKGTSNIQMMKAINSGKGSLVNIGLLNLAEAEATAKAAPQKPMFSNVGGERMI